MESNRKTENVVIIGSGPSGLAAALYAARANLKPLVLGGSPAGGQLTLTSYIENYPGVESILGSELIINMRKHAEKFGARFIDQNVLKVDFSKRPFQIYLPESAVTKFLSHDFRKNFVTAKSIIITTGAKALWLGLESEKRLIGKGVSSCATCDGFFFKEKTVGVVGGGDAACEEALTLTKFAEKVYIIHRRASLRASKIMQERVFANPKIEVIWNSQVIEVVGKDRVTGVKLQQIANQTTLSVDGLFIAIGHKPDTDVFKGQVEMDEKGYIITSARKALDIAKKTKKQFNNFDFNFQYITSVEGVFAAGDCVDFQYRQAVTAVGMGAAAALEVEKYLG